MYYSADGWNYRVFSRVIRVIQMYSKRNINSNITIRNSICIHIRIETFCYSYSEFQFCIL